MSELYQLLKKGYNDYYRGGKKEVLNNSINSANRLLSSTAINLSQIEQSKGSMPMLMYYLHLPIFKPVLNLYNNHQKELPSHMRLDQLEHYIPEGMTVEQFKKSLEKEYRDNKPSC